MTSTTAVPPVRQVTHGGRVWTIERSCSSQGWWRITIRDENNHLANRRRDLHEWRLDDVERQLLIELVG
jgi:hypothetical protein